ncbi:putative Serine threonine-protein kinase pkn1 [Candidatus Defluviicoccus seviourii]|uniref:Serine threonine-protein kinase pkn1 n=2 Tax=root TaxID=1 RepID=A0A564WD77_9PROT|nr:putative Serine threonine-protein kinase pkn1 [uncultured Defluviicoccus sp.]VUX46467.1 putative Serine threonine-protein kinase pkn1 [Candidatus Defluviicoccus seviourii]
MAAGDDEPRPISLFYSYSHKDEDLRQKLQEHLAVLRWDGRIAEWHDRNIDAGDDWAKAIDDNLKSADIVLLLVSASFLASPYCWGKEMSKALERNARDEATVIPVILRPCQWKQTRLQDLQAAPTDGRAVTLWPNLDEAFDDVAAKIVRVVDELRRKRAAAAHPHPVPLPEGEGASRPHPDPLPQAGEGGTRGSGRVRAFKDLEVFRDIEAPWCPEMVVIPAGTFLMGSPESEEGRTDAEGPQHTVTIGRRFAIGRFPVMFDEYDHFCALTKREKPKDEGWGRGKRPVINVSWFDAVAYCEWLAKETGQPYRLPSESEREYACRAGTTTRYWWGDAITPKNANYAESKLGKTTEVGAYPANPWGLYDINGNVCEWVADVWHDSYQRAPADGSAWTDGEGKDSSPYRVLRGGFWYRTPEGWASAVRYCGSPDSRGPDGGFRVARTLD